MLGGEEGEGEKGGERGSLITQASFSAFSDLIQQSVWHLYHTVYLQSHFHTVRSCLFKPDLTLLQTVFLYTVSTLQGPAHYK